MQSTHGIYVYENGGLRTLVDTETVIPGTSDPFSRFREFSADGADITFIAYGTETGGWIPDYVPNRHGVYRVHDGGLQVIADRLETTSASVC